MKGLITIDFLRQDATLNSPSNCQLLGLVVRVFANGPGDLGSIPGRDIPKTQKMVLDTSLLNTQHYKVRIKGKVEPSREGVAPSPTSWCSSYRKGSLRVTLDYGLQLYQNSPYLLNDLPERHKSHHFKMWTLSYEYQFFCICVLFLF